MSDPAKKQNSKHSLIESAHGSKKQEHTFSKHGHAFIKIQFRAHCKNSVKPPVDSILYCSRFMFFYSRNNAPCLQFYAKLHHLTPYITSKVVRSKSLLCKNQQGRNCYNFSLRSTNI